MSAIWWKRVNRRYACMHATLNGRSVAAYNVWPSFIYIQNVYYYFLLSFERTFNGSPSANIFAIYLKIRVFWIDWMAGVQCRFKRSIKLGQRVNAWCPPHRDNFNLECKFYPNTFEPLPLAWIQFGVAFHAGTGRVESWEHWALERPLLGIHRIIKY